jgi:uncharacterized protein YjiS (DUF1127 family)
MEASMKTIALSHPSAAAGKPLAARVFATVGHFFETRRQRRKLSELTPDLLQDVGLTPEDVRTELKRPVWDAPVQLTLK